MVLGWDIGIKNLAYCNIIEISNDETPNTTDYIYVNNRIFKILNWDIINLVDNLADNKEKTEEETNKKKKKKPKSANKLNLTILGKLLYEDLNQKPELLNCDLVLLENQPVFKNPTMKSMQMFVYSYFILKGLINTESPITDIKCYSARNKNKLIDYVDDECRKGIELTNSKVKSKYTKNKKAAIAMTEFFLNNNSVWYSKFKNCKKKDDLADSFLMSLHYLLK